MDSLKRGLSLQSGGLDILLCLIGTTATLISALYDEWIAAPIKQQEKFHVRLQFFQLFFSLHPQEFSGAANKMLDRNFCLTFKILAV